MKYRKKQVVIEAIQSKGFIDYTIQCIIRQSVMYLLKIGRLYNSLSAKQ